MSKKAGAIVPKDIWKEWEEMVLCASLIRQGKAKIMIVTGIHGGTYRYTKLR